MTPPKEHFEHKPFEVEEEKGTLELLQEGISKTSREIWLAGLGIFSTMDKEGTRLFNKFVEKGRDVVENGKNIKKNGEPAPTYIGEKVDRFSHDILAGLDDAAQFVQKKFFRFGESAKATQSEFQALTEKVDKLTESVAALVQKMEDKDKIGIRTKPAAI
jgi:poly(hydroxyalkanoate) granule-associated protein